MVFQWFWSLGWRSWWTLQGERGEEEKEEEGKNVFFQWFWSAGLRTVIKPYAGGLRSLLVLGVVVVFLSLRFVLAQLLDKQ